MYGTLRQFGVSVIVHRLTSQAVGRLEEEDDEIAVRRFPYLALVSVPFGQLGVRSYSTSVF